MGRSVCTQRSGKENSNLQSGKQFFLRWSRVGSGENSRRNLMLVSAQNLRCISALSSSSYSTTHQFRAAPFCVSCRAPSVSVSQITNDADGNDVSTIIAAAVDDSGFDGGASGGASGIHVPRQSYIAVSKSELLDAIISNMFPSHESEQAHQFLYLSQCLDSILHAEHKSILEEMRADYDLTLSTKGKRPGLNDSPHKGARTYMNSSLKSGRIDKEPEEEIDSDISMSSNFAFNLKELLDSSLKRNSKGSSDVIPVRFQQAFMKLLYNAEFEELSPQDLMLSSALNTNYLLTLPIYVDWKKASKSNCIIFRRGYATEIQKGLLIAEKFEYLQSKLLQNFFFLIAKPLGRFGIWLNEVFERISLKKDIGPTDQILIWLKEFSLSLQPNSSDQVCDDHEGVNSISNNLPIWEAAQKAVSRYEAVLSAVGPRERLLRKFFILLGLVPSKPMQAFDLDSKSTCESHLSDSFLPRITLSDIWKPATLENCGNDIWKMLRTSASILISESILQEPAFQQIILLYMEEIVERERVNQAEVPSLQMKIYEEIPIPDLQVVFPHKKLSFRILDSVRLDAATILGLLAYFLSYKFEDILSSPSALLLDVIAASALVIYVTRVLLGYKQTRDRYHLLVNRTLYEKTAASGFGCIHFLLDASEQQQYKEAILVYAILLKMEGGQVEMPVEKSIDTLVRLGLVTRETVDGQIRLQAVPCSRAHAILQKRWSSLIGCGD
ncbi:uncharacterized protein LOC142547478 isoform X2 [Primulina tabacum]|uniref:uncharacterized protein LOC142547478 isoform X2 n=1 Tax=Primulina tabacum TaxID=48773 RepID=UPI003F59A921